MQTKVQKKVKTEQNAQHSDAIPAGIATEGLRNAAANLALNHTKLLSKEELLQLAKIFASDGPMKREEAKLVRKLAARAQRLAPHKLAPVFWEHKPDEWLRCRVTVPDCDSWRKRQEQRARAEAKRAKRIQSGMQRIP